MGDLGNVMMNRRIFKDETSETGEIPFYKIGTFGSTPDAYITREKFDKYKAKYPYPKIGDILLAASGATIGKTIEFDGEDSYFQDSNIVWLEHDERLTASFLKQFYSLVSWRGLEGTAVPRLYNKIILETDISIPSPNEQVAIGNLFRIFDTALTLHKRKLMKLKELKKGYLQMMFPQCGENVPRLRFKGFTGDWQNKKAGEIFISVSDKNHPMLSVLSASQEKGMILRDEIGIDIKYDENALGTYKKIMPGQFAIHLRSFQGGFAHSTIEGITSPAYTILDFENQNEHDSGFWKEIFTSSIFIKRLETITYGIRDGRSISFSEFSTLDLTSPTKKEQIAIANFFRTLDRSIVAQQAGLDKLKQLKQAYLQKMFV